MITKYGTNVKRFVYEMAKSYKEYGSYWQRERIDNIVEKHESGMITERECVKLIVKTIEEMGAHYSFDDLDRKAQENCVDQYLNVMCPYDTDGSLENATFDEIAESINYWIGDQYWIDSEGNWWDEYTRVC